MSPASPQIPPDALAAALAARLIHDLSGAAHGVASALELLADPAAASLRDDALELAASSARSLADRLAFCRAAYAGSGESLSSQELERLAQSVFEGGRAKLAWSADLRAASPAKGRVLLLLAQVAAGGLGAGGCASIEESILDGDPVLTAMGQGQRARLAAEVISGLQGHPVEGGLIGRWAPAYFLHAAALGLAGEIMVQEQPGGFSIAVRLPN